MITTTSKFLRPLGAETLLVSRLAQGCRKGGPQTASVVGKKFVYLKSGWGEYNIYWVKFPFTN